MYTEPWMKKKTVQIYQSKHRPAVPLPIFFRNISNKITFPTIWLISEAYSRLPQKFMIKRFATVVYNYYSKALQLIYLREYHVRLCFPITKNGKNNLATEKRFKETILEKKMKPSTESWKLYLRVYFHTINFKFLCSVNPSLRTKHANRDFFAKTFFKHS